MSETLVDRIDECLKYRNLKRLALCEAVGITTTAITHWSTRKGLPSADTAVLIARYLDVSVDWLIFGTVSDPTKASSPQAIAERIENALNFLTSISIYTDETAWFKPLETIIPIHSFYNWRTGRNYPDVATVQKIADAVGLHPYYLLTGINESENDAFTSGLADKYESILKGFHCLTNENQKIIDVLIAHLRKLQ
jgi:transcriptional regulator with XRE-family HTH domain